MLTFLSRYSRTVRPPPQDGERSEEWGITAGMRLIGESFPSVGMKKSTLMEVSLYICNSSHSSIHASNCSCSVCFSAVILLAFS